VTAADTWFRQWDRTVPAAYLNGHGINTLAAHLKTHDRGPRAYGRPMLTRAVSSCARCQGHDRRAARLRRMHTTYRRRRRH